jgi:hypothetical protein
MNTIKFSRRSKMTRREFLRHYGVASSALTLSPFFLERMAAVCQAAAALTRVYKVTNIPTTNAGLTAATAKLWQMLDGPAKYINLTDIVVIKPNAQWPNQGYTHTGCIKGIIDQILQIPGFSGEILICDNIQSKQSSGNTGFDATLTPTNNRVNNWSDKNWNELAQSYQASSKPVATIFSSSTGKSWTNGAWRNLTSALPCTLGWNPADGNGWVRYFFNYAASGLNTYLSYPIFQSPLTSGRMIDMKNGVWENGSYTGRKVKTIFMPTLNNHCYPCTSGCEYPAGSEDYAGLTSAVKSFFGATEIQSGDDAAWNGYFSMHSGTFTQVKTAGSVVAQWAGELSGIYMKTFYAPVLYITPAIYSGYWSRGQPIGARAVENTAAATNTILACENPVSLDYISGRDVISKCGSPLATFLDPSAQNNNTWRQLVGCNSQGIGTLDPLQMDVITYDFNYPTATRLDIERKIRDFKAGKATEQDVKDVISLYMSSGS